MQIKPFRAVYPNFDYIASPDSFCENAKDSFLEYKKNGFFEHLPTDAFYIYQIVSSKIEHLGVVALNDVEDFFKGKIKKHEKTLSEREQKQMELFLRWNAILKPVLLAYRPVPQINDWLRAYTQAHKPLFSTKFDHDKQVHRVWAITEAAEQVQLFDLFQQHVTETYIADGHHRTSTVALLHERLKGKNKENFDFDNLFVSLFSADQLDILDYNRVVEGLKEVGITTFLVKMSKVFDLDVLEKPTRPTQKHEFTMFLRKDWYRLRLKPEVMEKYAGQQVLLDATLLNELVFKEIFDIQDVRTDLRITYIEGAKGLEGVRKAASLDNSRVGFVLHPVEFDDLMFLADKGESLPPKSTYFEPRLKSGLLVKMLKK